jgi:hypothetical protein
VRLATMQVNGDARDRDVGHNQGVKENLPTGCVQQAVRKKVQDRIYCHYHSKKKNFTANEFAKTTC